MHGVAEASASKPARTVKERAAIVESGWRETKNKEENDPGRRREYINGSNGCRKEDRKKDQKTKRPGL